MLAACDEHFYPPSRPAPSSVVSTHRKYSKGEKVVPSQLCMKASAQTECFLIPRLSLCQKKGSGTIEVAPNGTRIQVLETASPMFLSSHHMNIYKILTIFHFLTKKQRIYDHVLSLGDDYLKIQIACSCVAFTAMSTWIGSQVAQNCKGREEAHSCYFKLLQ